MPWGRVDDTWYDHPKLELLGEDRLAGAGLSSLAWSWCNRFLTDGLVPRTTVTKLGGTMDLADALVRVGLWDEAVDGYVIHDFLTYNDSREQVLKRRADEAKRKAQWRARTADKSRPDGSPSGTSNVNGADVPPSVPPGHGGRMSRRDTRARDVARIPTRPDPSRPIDSPQPPAERGARSRANGTNPRAEADAAAQLAAVEQGARRWRSSQRQLAYLRGAISEEQQRDMDQRDAPLTEIPDHEEHRATVAMDARVAEL